MKSLNRVEFDRLKNTHKMVFRNKGIGSKKPDISNPLALYEFNVLLSIYAFGFEYWKGDI